MEDDPEPVALPPGPDAHREGRRAGADNIGEVEPPHLSDESRWYTEHTALLISTLKWSLLGAATGICVGEGTRAFLWSLAASSRSGGSPFARARPFVLPPARGAPRVRLADPQLRALGQGPRHGSRHRGGSPEVREGRLEGRPDQAPCDRAHPCFRGLRGQGRPLCADRGRHHQPLRRHPAAEGRGSSALGDLRNWRWLRCRLRDARLRRALWHRGPVSGAHRILRLLPLPGCRHRRPPRMWSRPLRFHPFTRISPSLGRARSFRSPSPSGACSVLSRCCSSKRCGPSKGGCADSEAHPYWIAAGGGAALALFYTIVGDAYAGLGTPVIEASLAGVAQLFVLAFLFKILATAVTLETGGSGGIVTPLFFIGATSGAAVAQPDRPSLGRVRSVRVRIGSGRGRQHAHRGCGDGDGVVADATGSLCGPLCRDRLSHRGPPERLCEPEAGVLEVSGPRASSGRFDGRSDNRADENPEGQPDRTGAPTDRARAGQAQDPAVR